MDSTAPITLPEDLDAGSDPRPTALVGNAEVAGGTPGNSRSRSQSHDRGARSRQSGARVLRSTEQITSRPTCFSSESHELGKRTAEASGPLRPPSRSSKCVHSEHIGRRTDKGEVRQAEPATPAIAMSSYRLLVCLSVLGWSERDLARRTGRHQTTIVRWAKGLSPVPGEEAAWLETLAAFHIAHPAPRRRPPAGQLAND